MNFMNLAELVDASRSINENENNKKKLNKKIYLLRKFLRTYLEKKYFRQ